MKKVPGSTVVFGGQVGSEGKGAVVGYLARKRKYDAAICTFMTNAGHTWIGDNGEKVVVQQIPMAVVGPEVGQLLIAPGSAITMGQLLKEIDTYDKDYNVSNRLRIHPRAMIIEEEDVKYEQRATKYLGSTSKGCGRALARKAMRSNGIMAKPVRLARDIPFLRQFIADTTTIANRILDGGGSVLVEGSQGFDLDINHGLEYPYCTSRGTTPMATLADCGISERTVTECIAVVRTYPIRVGNVVEDGVQVGYSGMFGAKELTWEEVTQRSGSLVPLEERTTVTQRVRRVFEMDFARLGYMVDVCRPTIYALTFVDYLDHRIAGMDTAEFEGMGRENFIRTYPKVVNFLMKLDETGPLTGFLKTGPRDSDMIDLEAGVDVA